MSLAGYYWQKAEQCDRLATAATDPRESARYKNEGALWRGIAKDIEKQDRDQIGRP